MNVSQGDLAYIVKADVPEAIGRVCQVIEPLGVEYFDDFGFVFTWGVKLSHPCRDVDGVYRTDFAAPDLTLRRISGPSGSVDADEKVADQSPVKQPEPAEIA